MAGTRKPVEQPAQEESSPAPETPAAPAPETPSAPAVEAGKPRIVYFGPEPEVMCAHVVWQKDQPQQVDSDVAEVVLTHPHFKEVS